MILRHLDIWTAGRVRDIAHDPYAPLQREEIKAFTAKTIKAQLLDAAENSPVYQKLYKDCDIKAICAMDDSEFMREFMALPPATPELIKGMAQAEEDLQVTADFFNHGMRLMCDPSDVVLILVPGQIGSLMAKGIEEMGAKAVNYGQPASIKDEADAIIETIKKENVTSIVALPTHMIKLAREAERAGITDYDSPDFVQLRSILLCGEYAPEETVMMLEETFECCIYECYSIEDLAIGCAISCGYGNGYHVSESDLFIEIVDPRNGNPMPEGAFGEIVITTLTRKGAPLLRYRTGEFSRWIPEPCMCGSGLKRLDKVGSRDIIKGILVDKINGR